MQTSLYSAMTCISTLERVCAFFFSSGMPRVPYSCVTCHGCRVLWWSVHRVLHAYPILFYAFFHFLVTYSMIMQINENQIKKGNKQKLKIRHRDIIESLCAFHRAERRGTNIRTEQLYFKLKSKFV